MGDPAGIGIEIALKAWRVRRGRRLAPFVLFADPDAASEVARKVAPGTAIQPVAGLEEGAAIFDERLPLRPVRMLARPVAGRPDPANAPAVIAAIEGAVAAVESGEAAAVVTNPIAKATLASAGFSYPGHTEFLAALAGRHHPGHTFHPVMMLAAEELRVVPLTIHIPLKDVPTAVTSALIAKTVRVIDEALGRPRIAVAGLNPHAGESGTIGREDAEVIGPAIRDLASQGYRVSGPYPADTMFHAGARKRYDIAIAMYHDQALIPIKTLAFDRGVNVTLGLPFVRTSPDHGTAFDIAGRGIANPESLIQALLMADAMAGARASGGARS
jgi:4-hydroxythreonine-4-phosphate dehydrogenase